MTRGAILESEHRVHAVVAGAEGSELVWGEPDFQTTLRSAARLIQALPLVEDGVADEPRHVEGARATAGGAWRTNIFRSISSSAGC